MLRAIIFDWHGVLDKVSFGGLIQELVKLSGKTISEVKEKVGAFGSLERSYSAGKLKPTLFWDKVQESLSLDKAKIGQARSYLLTIRKNRPLWEKLPKLKQHFKLAILSECPADKAEKIRQLDLSPFNKVYLSAELKLLKNDKKFFLKVTKSLKVKPQNCLYVDDLERHLITAAKLGFKTCHFRSLKDLDKCLVKD